MPRGECLRMISCMPPSETEGTPAPRPDRRLRPTERVQRPGEFQVILKSGRCFRDPLMRIHFRENRRELSRLGMVVSKKVGGAVVRNRLKRVFREVFRAAKSRFPVPLDVVLVPDRSAGVRKLPCSVAEIVLDEVSILRQQQYQYGAQLTVVPKSRGRDLCRALTT